MCEPRAQQALLTIIQRLIVRIEEAGKRISGGQKDKRAERLYSLLSFKDVSREGVGVRSGFLSLC